MIFTVYNMSTSQLVTCCKRGQSLSRENVVFIEFGFTFIFFYLFAHEKKCFGVFPVNTAEWFLYMCESLIQKVQ